MAPGWLDSWHRCFNLRIEELEASEFFDPLPAPREESELLRSTIQNLIGSVTRQQGALESEVVLMKRIIHRNRNQHRNSLHLRHLMQLRNAVERRSQAAVPDLLSSLLQCSNPGASQSPSRQLMELTCCRLVTAGVLCDGAARAAQLLHKESLRMLTKGLFMPFAATALALASRIYSLTVLEGQALEECHLRLSALKSRLPSASVLRLNSFSSFLESLAPPGSKPLSFSAHVSKLHKLIDGDIDEWNTEEAVVQMSGEKVQMPNVGSSADVALSAGASTNAAENVNSVSRVPGVAGSGGDLESEEDEGEPISVAPSGHNFHRSPVTSIIKDSLKPEKKIKKKKKEKMQAATSQKGSLHGKLASTVNKGASTGSSQAFLAHSKQGLDRQKEKQIQQRSGPTNTAAEGLRGERVTGQLSRKGPENRQYSLPVKSGAVAPQGAQKKQKKGIFADLLPAAVWDH